MPRFLLGALVALALAPVAASAVTPTVAVRTVAAGCAPKGAFAVPIPGAPLFEAGEHRYVVAAQGRTPCATLPVTTTATEGAVRLRWTAVPGATGYTIHRDGETVATAVACCELTDTSPTTEPGAPPPVAAESARAGSGPDLAVTEDLAYDEPTDTIGQTVLRLPAGLFLAGGVTGEALAVVDGTTVPGGIAPTDDPSRLTLTLRPEGDDPIEVPMTLSRRDDGGTDVTATFGGLRLDRLRRTFYGDHVVLPTSCAAKSVRLEADGARASAPLQATDCAALPFGPALGLALEATGQSGAGDRPALTATVTQPPGEAAARAVTITLPEGVSAPGGLSAVGTSPFAPGPLTAPVATTGTPTGRSVLTLDGLPETPLTELRLGAALANTRGLCAGLGPADAAYVGHNGATVTARVPIAVAGAPATCPPPEDPPVDPPEQLPARPEVAVAARVGRSGRPRLALTIRAGNAVAGSSLRRGKIRIPRGLRLTRGARRRLAVTVDARRTRAFTVRPRLLTVRAPAASRIISVTARRGALRAGARARRRLSFRVSVLTQSGRTYRIARRVTPRA